MPVWVKIRGGKAWLKYDAKYAIPSATGTQLLVKQGAVDGETVAVIPLELLARAQTQDPKTTDAE